MPTNVALLCAAGKGFSSAGGYEPLDGMMADYDTRMQVMREARDLQIATGPASHRERRAPGSRAFAETAD